jgi:hypothetical protein
VADEMFKVVRSFEDLTCAFEDMGQQEALPGTTRWCSKCGEVEGTEWFKVGRCDTEGGL